MLSLRYLVLVPLILAVSVRAVPMNGELMERIADDDFDIRAF